MLNSCHSCPYDYDRLWTGSLDDFGLVGRRRALFLGDCDYLPPFGGRSDHLVYVHQPSF